MGLRFGVLYVSISNRALATATPSFFNARLGKRTFNLTAATLLLTLSLSLIALLALLLRCPGGPAFFLHERVGLSGLQFARALAVLMVLTGRVIAEAEHYFVIDLPGDAIP